MILPRLITRSFSSTSMSTRLASTKGAQDTFYFQESDITKSINNKSTPLYTKLYNKIPVVLVLGWTGARDQHVQKYNLIYSQLGYHTIRFAPSNSLTFLNPAKHKSYAYNLLDMLKTEYRLENNPILTHMFSNASCFIVYQHIIDELSKGKDYEFFGLNHKGIIYDSAPGWSTSPLKLLTGIAELSKAEISNPVLRYMVSTVLVGVAVGYHLGHLKEHYFSRMYRTLVNDPRLVPTLSLYSTIDKLISSESIQELIDERKKLYPSLYQKTVVYKDAEHVLLYQKHPEDYLKHVYEHLEFCGLDMKRVMEGLDVSELNLKLKSKL